MSTFTRGDATINFEPGESIQTLITIADSTDAYRRRQHREAELCKVKHGHQFGDNRRCRCGMSEKQYAYDRPRDVCRAVVNPGGQQPRKLVSDN